MEYVNSEFDSRDVSDPEESPVKPPKDARQRYKSSTKKERRERVEPPSDEKVHGAAGQSLQTFASVTDVLGISLFLIAY